MPPRAFYSVRENPCEPIYYACDHAPLWRDLMDETALTKRRAAFEAEALRFLNEIYASAMQMARNVQAAEDLTAITFEQAWKAYDRFEPGTNMRAWLYRILTNTFIDDFRKKKRSKDTVSVDEYENASTSTVARFLAPRFKFSSSTVFRMLGHTNNEIAEEFVITENTGAKHVANILSKTASANRVEAANYASAHGLL
ncbi:MAG: sigma-70 family RNA polymerase sigma factor [Chloroflexi bacterium]|nr:sigma-70 family RNA polymerase sigma factor [Chloroflexota bacterium]